jgi:OFA family oxalate/formate antiporter-like MFS transporter
MARVGVAAPSAVYYGWKVVAALFIAGFVVYGGGLYSFVLFVTPLTQEFHWSRAATGGIVSAFWLTAPLIIFGGFGIQRFGVLRMLIAGILIEASCVLLLASVSTLWEIYLLRAAMGFGKLLFALTIPVTIAVWFERRFALALGIAWSGWHVGGMALAPVTAWIIAHYGWRGACVALAGTLLTLALAPALWVLRVRSPAERGLAVDGSALDGAVIGNDASFMVGSRRDNARVGHAGLRSLLRAPAFWLIAVATVFFYSAYGGLLAHQTAIVQSAGYSMQTASLVLGSTAGFAALGGLTIGWALDRYPLMPIAVLVHGLLIAGASALLFVSWVLCTPMLVAYAACFGLTIGGSDIFFVKLMRRAFPEVSVAHTYSAWYCVELLTLFLAPIAAGWVFDQSGNYR